MQEILRMKYNAQSIIVATFILDFLVHPSFHNVIHLHMNTFSKEEKLRSKRIGS